MRLSSAFAVLAATAVGVDAWKVRFFESWTCSPVAGKSMRYLSSDKQGDCFSFGADMPGVQCSEAILENGRISSRGCGNPLWRPHAAGIENGRGCTIFKSPNCEGSGEDTGPSRCRVLSTFGDSTMRSIRCYD